MKKHAYPVPTVVVRGDVVRETLGFKKANCGEQFGRLECAGSGLSFGL